jgi:predicted phosphodiesterase
VRIAFISDIHANAVALAAALDAIRREPVDRLICLGDVASDGPQPCETLRIVRELQCAVIMGNADAQLLGLEPEIADPAFERFNRASRWCADVLEPEDRAFLASFAPRLTLDCAGTAPSLFHGSPKSFNDEIYPTTSDEVLRAFIADHPAAVHVGGHTHFQMLRRIDGSMFVNPGTIGMAYDRTRGSPGHVRFGAWAEFAIVELSSSGWDVSLRRVPFEVDQLIAAIRSSGLPDADWWSSAWKAAATL